MPSIKFENLLATVFSSDGKDSMKADKAIKRAVKLAVLTSSTVDTSKKEIKKQLKELLSRGNVPGYQLADDRLVKIAAPPPAAPAATEIDEKKEKKKKKKKRQRTSSSDSEDNDTRNLASNTNLESREAENSQEKEKKSRKKRQKRGKEKRQKKSQGQENDSPPTTTPTTAANNTIQQTNATTAAAVAAGGGGNEDLAWRASLKRTDIKSGAYSAAEQQIIRNGVIAFAQARNLSTEDFSWIFAGKGQRSSDILGLWKQVALALPNRTIKSVAAAGNRLFHPDANKGKWTPEEDAELRAYVSELGNKWVEIGSRLGRPREACRVRWREIQLGDEKKVGKWSPDEEERLENAVNEYLQAKKEAEGASNTGNGVPLLVAMPADGGAGPSRASGFAGTPSAAGGGGGGTITTATTPLSKKIDKRIVLDDIDWGVISQRVKTRSNIQCLEKWYDQLVPSMVDRGEWGTGDDRRLLRSLWRAGNVAEFEVQWEALVPSRTAQQARRRWRLMVKVVPEYKEKEFSEVVEYLVDKYVPQLKEKEPRGEEEATD